MTESQKKTYKDNVRMWLFRGAKDKGYGRVMRSSKRVQNESEAWHGSPVHRALAQDGCRNCAWLNLPAFSYACDVVIVTVFVCTRGLVAPQTVFRVIEAPSPLTADAIPIEILALRSYTKVACGLRETSMAVRFAPLVGLVAHVRHDQDRYGTKGADHTDDSVLANIRST